MLYHWVTETVPWARLLQGPYVRCILQSAMICNVESITVCTKTKITEIVKKKNFLILFQYIKVHYSHLMHLTDPSSAKQQSFCECGFSRVNMGRDTNISDFWLILLSLKGNNVHSHAQLKNKQWFCVIYSLIYSDIHHHSGQNVVDS